MTIKYVSSLNEKEQRAIELIVRNIAQEMFLDSEETEEAVQHTLDSKVDDLNEFIELYNMETLKEVIQLFSEENFQLHRKNEFVDMAVNVLNSSNNTFQVLQLEKSFESLVDDLVYNESDTILNELNNPSPYNNYDLVYFRDKELYALISVI